MPEFHRPHGGYGFHETDERKPVESLETFIWDLVAKTLKVVGGCAAIGFVLYIIHFA